MTITTNPTGSRRRNPILPTERRTRPAPKKAYRQSKGSPVMSKEVGPGAVTGHGCPKYAMDESGDETSDSFGKAFRNEGLDVQGLCVLE
jgi:hypothetical protein